MSLTPDQEQQIIIQDDSHVYNQNAELPPINLTVEMANPGHSYRPALIKAGAFLVAAAVAVGGIESFYHGLPGINNDRARISATDKLVQPLDLQCLALNTVAVAGHERSKLGGWFGGYEADITADTQSLLCIHDKGVQIDNNNDGSTHVTVDAGSSSEVFTRFKEDTKNQVADNVPGISGMGDGIADQLAGLHLPSWKNLDHNQQAKVARRLASEIINEVDQDCTQKLWLPRGADGADAATIALLLPADTQLGQGVIQQVYTEAYRQEAAQKGRDPKRVSVNFVGTPHYQAAYPIEKDGVWFKSSKHIDFTCSTDSTAVDFKIADLRKPAQIAGNGK